MKMTQFIYFLQLIVDCLVVSGRLFHNLAAMKIRKNLKLYFIHTRYIEIRKQQTRSSTFCCKKNHAVSENIHLLNQQSCFGLNPLPHPWKLLFSFNHPNCLVFKIPFLPPLEVKMSFLEVQYQQPEYLVFW